MLFLLFYRGKVQKMNMMSEILITEFRIKIKNTEDKDVNSILQDLNSGICDFLVFSEISNQLTISDIVN